MCQVSTVLPKLRATTISFVADLRHFFVFCRRCPPKQRFDVSYISFHSKDVRVQVLLLAIYASFKTAICIWHLVLDGVLAACGRCWYCQVRVVMISFVYSIICNLYLYFAWTYLSMFPLSRSTPRCAFAGWLMSNIGESISPSAVGRSVGRQSRCSQTLSKKSAFWGRGGLTAQDG